MDHKPNNAICCWEETFLAAKVGNRAIRVVGILEIEDIYGTGLETRFGVPDVLESLQIGTWDGRGVGDRSSHGRGLCLGDYEGTFKRAGIVRLEESSEEFRREFWAAEQQQILIEKRIIFC